jgi:hypothetical protein
MEDPVVILTQLKVHPAHIKQTFRVTGILSIIWYSKNKKTHRFRNWICLCPHVREGKTPTLLGPLVAGQPMFYKLHLYKHLRSG